MILVQCLIYYCIEYLKYFIAYSVFWNKKMRHVWIALLGGVTLGLMLVFGNIERNSAKILLIAFGAMLSAFFTMEDRIKRRVLRLIEIVIINLSTDSICGMLIDYIKKISKQEWGSEYLRVISIGIATVIMYGCWRMLKKLGFLKRVNELEGKRIILIAFVMIFNVFFSIATLNHIRININDPGFLRVIDFLTISSYVSVGIVSVLIIELRQKNLKIKKMLKQEKTQKEMQAFYYEALLSKEENTRRYRHDMSNHIICLEAIVRKNDFTRARKYLGDMVGNVKWDLDKSYNIRHRILDIITNYQLAKLDSSVKKNVYGSVRRKLDIADIDISVLYNNLLQNAVEEVQKNGEGKFIEIYFEQGREFCEIRIINSLSQESRMKTDILISEKEDIRNHGFGLRNVNEVIKKCNGKINFLREEDRFTVVVLLRNYIKVKAP